MKIVIDCETYRKYDGSNEQELAEDFFLEDDRKKFLKEKEAGKYYPSLNARNFCYGCVLMEDERVYSFYKREDMVNFILNLGLKKEKEGKKLYVYGHNIEYDFISLFFDRILNLIEEKKLKIISTNPFLVSFINEKGKSYMYFIDTMSFFRGSLKELGEIIGKEKKEMPFGATIEQIKEYCDNDCLVLMRFLKLLEENLAKIGIKPKKLLTAGQVAMSSFLNFIKKNKTYYDFLYKGEVIKSENIEKCRLAYKGPRTEVFREGEFDNCTLLDINSLYPYIMSNMPIPICREEIFIKKPLLKGLRIKEILNDDYVGVLSCEFRLRERKKIGYLGVRADKYLVFPREEGTLLRGYWTTEEVKKAVSLGYDLSYIYWILLYPKAKNNIFKDFFEGLYKLRNEIQDEKMKLTIKMLMNNLYGKFGQKREEREIIIVHRADMWKYLKEGFEVVSIYGEKSFLEKKSNNIYPAKYSNVLISCLVTALGRDYLYNFLEKIDEKDLLYCDTDSIILRNFEKYEKIFKVGKNMGEWKIVDRGKCRIIKEKSYFFNEKPKISGLSKVLQKELVENNNKEITQKKMIGLGQITRKPFEIMSDLGKFKEEKFNFFGDREKAKFMLFNYYNELVEN